MGKSEDTDLTGEATELPSLVTESELLERAASGDGRARDEVVRRYLPLAKRLAARYRRAGEPIDDLIQVASLGLIKAAERFETGRGTAFSSYAVPTILGELKRHFRDRGWALHVPRELQERVLRMDRAVEGLTTELGRAPSVAELARRLAIDEEAVLEAMEVAATHEPSSLDESRHGEDGSGAPVEEVVGGSDPGFEVVEYGASIAETLAELTERDRQVLHLRFVEDMTQSQIAEAIGVSQMHVSRILRGALQRLRDAAGEPDDTDFG